MTDFSKQLTAALSEYSSSCEEEIQKAVQDVAKQAQKKLSSTSPVRTGKYKGGWKVKIERRSGYCKARIHNKYYQLTHLLEHGHKVHKTGHAAALPHIASVEQWAVKEAEKRIKEALQK